VHVIILFQGDSDFLALQLLPKYPKMCVGFNGRVTFAKATDMRRALFEVRFIPIDQECSQIIDLQNPPISRNFEPIRNSEIIDVSMNFSAFYKNSGLRVVSKLRVIGDTMTKKTPI
jgi:hypothetical protein